MFKFIQDNKIKEVREEDTFNRAFYEGADGHLLAMSLQGRKGEGVLWSLL